ncbi:DUF2332 domain-containing protein [Sphingomonas sp. CBMAI 2297]|uniref:DUF2332 domain-containing protein n=1 Tax=Sphingomonas sp. CBMAI 2297 TaxID=2991720 RepID=UPI002456F7FB|nr:DUF2332 family protein [Sphingomonas sp. CBMAI 2297]MDH4744281.1 DUF2332 domain-containing protein [Sphingomonas sp. CBMAI 2297]
MASEENNRGAFRIQEFYCRKMDAPIYAGICVAIADGLTRGSETGRRVLDWPGEPTRDALPLRLVGGLHALVLAGSDAELAEAFAGRLAGEALQAALNRVLARHDAALLPWLDGPPQTNEPGRSGALIVGLIEVARRHGPKLEILEIGSSGGLNLLIDRYRFDLGGALLGPADAPVTIAPAWLGDPPALPPLEIVSTRGCDVAPLDVTDPAVAARLSAYVWAETPMRLERLRKAIAMVRAGGVDLTRADAADWVEARLAEPQAAGVTRVLMHSVVWQYVPDASTARIRAAMETAGAAATPERPLAWVAMEPDRALGEQVVSVRTWPDGGPRVVVATAHAHAAWVRPGAERSSEQGILLDAAAAVRL